MHSYWWWRIRDVVRPLLAQVLQSCVLRKEFLGTGIGVTLFYSLEGFSSIIVIPRVFVRGVEPIHARLILTAYEVDSYTNSIQVVSNLPQYVHELSTWVIFELLGLTDQFTFGSTRWSMSAGKLGSSFWV